jgi:hypothetical protein
MNKKNILRIYIIDRAFIISAWRHGLEPVPDEHPGV